MVSSWTECVPEISHSTYTDIQRAVCSFILKGLAPSEKDGSEAARRLLTD